MNVTVFYFNKLKKEKGPMLQLNYYGTDNSFFTKNITQSDWSYTGAKACGMIQLLDLVGADMDIWIFQASSWSS
jgi:hypothetical protein